MKIYHLNERKVSNFIGYRIHQQLEQANSFMMVVLNNPAVYLGWFGYLDKATIRAMEKLYM
jgi:hypothetical protein